MAGEDDRRRRLVHARVLVMCGFHVCLACRIYWLWCLWPSHTFLWMMMCMMTRLSETHRFILLVWHPHVRLRVRTIGSYCFDHCHAHLTCWGVMLTIKWSDAFWSFEFGPFDGICALHRVDEINSEFIWILLFPSIFYMLSHLFSHLWKIIKNSKMLQIDSIFFHILVSMSSFL